MYVAKATLDILMDKSEQVHIFHLFFLSTFFYLLLPKKSFVRSYIRLFCVTQEPLHNLYTPKSVTQRSLTT